MASKNIKGITIEIGGNTTKLQDALKGVDKQVYGLNNDLKSLNQALKLDPKNTELLAQKQDILKNNISATSEKLKTLVEAQKQMGSYNSLTDEQKSSYNALSLEIAKSKSALEGMNKELKDSNKTDLTKLKDGLKKVGDVAADVTKKMLQVSTAVGGALAGLVTAGVKSYADLEQNIGGVETLFKDNADKVVENAKNAYKTAGVSANEYMAGVTSFSASLLQSLSGDTAKAADVADMAFRDMSDNANKFGTDMSSIQNAYQGFAKQNYTMLDNLKLGYGGTKTEMERLLADAEKISGVKYNISNLSDVYNAIHVIQEELGVTGTTAEEAEKTISGSVNSMKAAFDNFLNGSGSPEALAESVTNVLKNVSKAIVELAPNILNGVVVLTKELLPQVAKILIDLVPQLLDAVTDLLDTVLDELTHNTDKVAQTISVLINQVVNFISNNLPKIIEAGVLILITLTEAIIRSLPELIKAIPRIIIGIVNALDNGLDSIKQMGKNILLSILNGIVSKVGDLIEYIKNIVPTIIAWLKEGLSGIKDVGKQLIAGLWQGVEDKWNSLKNKVANFGNGIVKKFKSVFGIASPSKVFKNIIGKNLALGVSEGFTDTMDKVSKDMTKAIPTSSLLSNYNSAMSGLSYGINNSANPMVNPNISKEQAYSSPLILQIENFNNKRETDIQSLAQELEYYRRNTAQAKGGN